MNAPVAVAAALSVAATAALVASSLMRAGAGWSRDAPALVRRNWAGRAVPVSGGLVVAASTVLTLAAVALVVPAVAGSDPSTPDAAVLPVLALTVGFAFLGAVDDLLGDDTSKGFRGHLRALRHGRVTTGMLKLAGGAALAVVVAAAVAAPSNLRGVVTVVVQAAVVALCANLANLLDRAPGRLLKASVVAGVPLLGVALLPASAATGVAVAAAAPFGASWALLPADQKERCMLGDAGANVIGAVTGWLLVTVLSPTGTVVALVVVLGANVLSEFVSFSRIIDAVAPLRALDRWGRLPADDAATSVGGSDDGPVRR